MLGFVIAMKNEAQILLNHMEIVSHEDKAGRDVYVGKAYGRDVVLCICGVGKVNAAIGTEYLIAKFPIEKIINFGVAGGLNSSMEIAGIYAISHSVEYDFDLCQLNGTPMGTLNEFTEPYLPLSVLEGYPLKKLGTGDRFNDDKKDFILLSETLKADIRDMEGSAIVHTAFKEGVPVYSIKAISDLAGNGSTTEQFLENMARALRNLENELPTILKKL